MGKQMGEQSKYYIESEGRPVNIEERFKGGFDDDSVYSFAWKSGKKTITEHEAIVEWLECPFAEGFKAFGKMGVEIGEWFCSNIDNAVSQGIGSQHTCIRETSLNKDGVCTLHFKLEEN